MDNSLVILPTIRNPKFIEAYLTNAKEHSFDLSKLEFMVLTEDFVDKLEYKKIFAQHGIHAQVLNQQDRDKMLAEMGLSRYAELIPKRSRAEESFALLYIWANDYKYGFTIDDDTLPVKDFDFFGDHIKNLNYKGKITEYSSDKGFVNVLHHSFEKHHLYPRGYPYCVTNEKISSKRVEIEKVGFSQGLWTNIPDLDAIRILQDGDLNGQARTRLSIDDYGENFTVAIGDYVTVCSMNLAFRRDVIPAFYQYKMGDNPWKVDRFDDIWSGIVAKKFIDIFGYRIVNGKPLCQHNKAPRSTFKDLVSEAAGLEANEVLYKIVENTKIGSKNQFEIISEIATSLKSSNYEFIKYCGGHLEMWIEALNKIR